MKKMMMTLALTLALMLAQTLAPVKAQPAHAAADSIDEVEAFSDTTSVDSVTAGVNAWDGFDDDGEWDEWDSAMPQSVFQDLDVSDGFMSFFGSLMVVLVCLFLVFVLIPIGLIALILYFVYKNRKDRMRLMEMALKTGRQIPVDALGTPYVKNEQIWNKGIKQVFLGAGLAFLLWIPFGKLGLAIGALVLLIGCGNVVIAYNAKKKEELERIFRPQAGQKEADRPQDVNKPQDAE